MNLIFTVWLLILMPGPDWDGTSGIRIEAAELQPSDPNRPALLREAVERFRSGDLNRAEDLLRYFVKTGIPMEDRMEGYAYRVLIQIQKQDFERGGEILNEMETVLENSVREGDILWSDLYRMRSGFALHQYRTEEAIRWAERALATSMESDRRPIRQVRSLMVNGLAHEASGDYARAEIYFRSALARMERMENRHEQVWLSQKVIRNLATARFELGHLNDALDLFQQQRDLLLKIYDEGHLEVTINRLNRGRIYAALGDHALAVDYFVSAIRRLKSHKREYASTLLQAHGLAGYSYAQLGDGESSQRQLRQAMELARDRFDDNHPEMPKLYLQLATYDLMRGELQHALEKFDSAMRAWDEKIEADHPLRIPIYLGRAEIYRKLGETDQAMDEYQRALDIAESRYLQRHPGHAEIWLGMARIYKDLAEWNRALDAYVQAQKILTPVEIPADRFSHPSYSGSLHARLFLDVIQGKAEVLQTLYTTNGESTYLTAAYSAYLLAIQTMEKIQLRFQDEDSKLVLNRNHYSLFEHAVDVAYQLWKQTGDALYLEEIYLIGEAGKARVSREQTRWSDLDDLDHLPTSLVEKEKSMLKKISRLHHELDRLNVSGRLENRTRLEEVQDSLFQLHHEKEIWLQHVARTNPEYGNWRMQRELMPLQTVQNQVVAPDQVVVSYLFGRENLYVTLIGQNHLSVHRLEGGQRIEGWIGMLRESIRTEDRTTFRKASRQLYRHLIQPIEPITSSYRQLLVLPDAHLNYLPFNLLLSEQVAHNRSWEWPYLIRKYELSYAPSLMIYQETRNQDPVRGEGFLAVAPWTRVDRDVVVPQAAAPVAGLLSPLPLSKYEVEVIADTRRRSQGLMASLFDRKENTLLMDSEATPDRLRALDLTKYRYIHMATHAYVHERQPSLSGILLSPSDGSRTNGTLFLSDIEALNLNAYLVVLSACETGLGTLARGEGVIGFSRAFLKSGSQNLVVSLWKVNDRATAQLMEHLYRRLFNGASVSSALRDAQLALIDQSETSFPSHWSSFILIGS
ncbi:MAG: CHAT domain-containing protein [Balneolaceae bacterium]